jgi:hypothetical protein
MISKFNICEKNEKAIDEINKLFDKYGYKNNNISFSQYSHRYELAELMYSCMSNMNAEKLTIDDEEFFFKFDIYELNAIIDRVFGENKNTLAKIYRDFSDQLKVIKAEELTTQERDDKFHFSSKSIILIIIIYNNKSEELIIINDKKGKLLANYS